MKTAKFYALLKGSKKSLNTQIEKVYDKKSRKSFSKVVESEIDKPVSIVLPLEDAKNRIQALNDAKEYAKKNGLKLEGIHSFN